MRKIDMLRGKLGGTWRYEPGVYYGTFGGMELEIHRQYRYDTHVAEWRVYQILPKGSSIDLSYRDSFLRQEGSGRYQFEGLVRNMALSKVLRGE